MKLHPYPEREGHLRGQKAKPRSSATEQSRTVAGPEALDKALKRVAGGKG